MSLRSGSFTNSNTLVPLCGSEIGDLLDNQYAMLSSYWISDTSANQYIVWNEEIISAETFHISGTFPDFIWESCGTVAISSVALTGGNYITYILDSIASDINKINFTPATGSLFVFGYTTFTTGGIPTGYSNGPRPEVTNNWSNLFLSAGLYTDILQTASMTGSNGWVVRLWNPYLGLKRVMMLNEDVLFDTSGWWTSGTSSFPCGSPSNLAPITTDYYNNAYVSAYFAIDDYLYNWSSILQELISANNELLSFNAFNNFRKTNIYSNWTDAIIAAQDAWDRLSGIDFVGAGAQPRFLFTASDDAVCTYTDYEYTAEDFRTTGYINGIRQTYDSSAFYLPASGYQNTSTRIWDEGTRRVLHYVLKNYTLFDVIRDFIPSAY